MLILKMEEGERMKTNDYVKFMTQTAVKYMNQPKDERTRQRTERKNNKEPFLYRWFGVVPMAAYLFGAEVKHKVKEIKLPQKLLINRFRKVN